ncbi:MAG: HEAT repeat domain-containing protein [Promethearchaeota archaeon]
MSESWHEKNKEFNALIKELFQAEDWQKRSEAARQLGYMRDGRAVNLLCRALRSEKDKMVQNRIIEAMGRIGDGRATLRIIEKMSEELKSNNIDKYRIIYMIESLTNIKDKRALTYIGQFLNSPDKDLKKLAEKAFDKIEPNWRQIIEKERKEKSIEEIFKNKI